ncbi:hypothetical protein DFH11DRAFT_1852932 [Phellopilus nigrolimitatus]|nr:hypothetical protein DFH11DRAFT_1852932 [Phellopilus nigrolimitatus]
MGKTYDHIPEKSIKWIREQEVFWVATAPLSANGHINISPKGLRGSFYVEGPNKVWYNDMTGSGCETIAHIRENGRITILFNALKGAPEIVRLHGTGVVHEFGTVEYDARVPASKRMPGSRSVIVVDVHRVGTSCGFGVPVYDFVGHRTTLLNMSIQYENKDNVFESQSHEDGALCESGLRGYWRAENSASIDGLPGLGSALDTHTPFVGVMPGPEGAFRSRPAKSSHAHDQSLSLASTSEKDMFANGNFKLLYGLHCHLPRHDIFALVENSRHRSDSFRESADKIIKDTNRKRIPSEAVTTTTTISHCLSKLRTTYGYTMGKTYDHIPDKIIHWMKKQEVFWVATAPLSGDGHVNLSPKGLRGTFHVEGPNKVWYEDLSGTGCETIAHIRENGRITVMFNALEGAPEILRLYGRGFVHEFGTAEYDARIHASKRLPGSRAVIVVDVHRVGTTCGFGVPVYSFVGHRTSLLTWSGQLEKKDNMFQSQNQENGVLCESGLRGYWRAENKASIDGLPGLESAPDTRVPLIGVMPGPIEGAFRPQKSKSIHVQSPTLTCTPEKNISAEGNIKLLYGVVVGLLATFILRDIFAAAKGSLKM